MQQSQKSTRYVWDVQQCDVQQSPCMNQIPAVSDENIRKLPAQRSTRYAWDMQQSDVQQRPCTSQNPAVSDEWFLVPSKSTTPQTGQKKPREAKTQSSQSNPLQASQKQLKEQQVMVIYNWSLLPTMCIVGTNKNGQQITTSPVVRAEQTSKSTNGSTTTLAVTASGRQYLVRKIDPAFSSLLGHQYPSVQWSEETCLAFCLQLHQQELARKKGAAQAQHQMQTQPLSFPGGGYTLGRQVATQAPQTWFEDAPLQSRQQPALSVQGAGGPTLNVRLAAGKRARKGASHRAWSICSSRAPLPHHAIELLHRRKCSYVL